MNYTEDIRSAVDFMESHITEQLDYAEIAAAIPEYFRTHLKKTAGDYAELLSDNRLYFPFQSNAGMVYCF